MKTTKEVKKKGIIRLIASSVLTLFLMSSCASTAGTLALALGIPLGTIAIITPIAIAASNSDFGDNYSPPSSSASSSSGAWISPIRSGLYTLVGSNMTIRFSSIGRSGLFFFNGSDMGSYSIDSENTMTLKFPAGYVAQATIVSETTFVSGDERWVWTSY